MYKAEGFLNHDTKIRLRCISGGIRCRRKENVMKNKNSYVILEIIGVIILSLMIIGRFKKNNNDL